MMQPATPEEGIPMPKIRWDRTLETCVKREMNALLIAEQPPLWRSDLGLRAGCVPALEHEDIASMVSEIMPQRDRISQISGCRSFCLRYGGEYSFRVDMLGDPAPHTVILTRLPPDAPEFFREGIGLYEGWNCDWPKMSWRQHLAYIEQGRADLLLVPGCPPLSWSKLGLHACTVPVLDDDEVCWMIEEMMPPPGRRVQRQGIIRFRIRPSLTSEFIAAVFEYPSPTLALLTRYSEAEPDAGQGKV